MKHWKTINCLMPCVVLLAAGCAKSPAPALVTAPAGLTFQAPVVLSGSGTQFATVTVAASNQGQRAFVWSATPPGDGTLYLQIQSAAPVSVPEPEGAAGMDPETPPKVAYGPKGEIYIAYSINEPPKPAGKVRAQPTDPGTSFRVIRSDDRGKTWANPGHIADDGLWGAYRNDHAFHVSTDGKLYAAWLDGRIPDTARLYFSRSVDRGATWSTNVAVDADSPCECCRIALASSAPEHVYMAWRKILPGGVRDIVVAHSADGGTTWNAPVLTHADDWKIDGCPDAGPSLLAEADGRLHLVWWTGKEGAAGVKFVSSADGGQTWAAPVALKVGAASRASHAQIARGAGDTLYVTWDDGLSPEPQILLAVSHDNGKHFDKPMVLSEPGATAAFPALAVTRDLLTVVWHQPDPQRKEFHQVIMRSANTL